MVKAGVGREMTLECVALLRRVAGLNEALDDGRNLANGVLHVGTLFGLCWGDECAQRFKDGDGSAQARAPSTSSPDASERAFVSAESLNFVQILKRLPSFDEEDLQQTSGTST